MRKKVGSFFKTSYNDLIKIHQEEVKNERFPRKLFMGRRYGGRPV